MTRDDWAQSLLDGGYIDERKAFTTSNIKCAPRGEFGAALLCVKGDELAIYDTDFHGNPGQFLYAIRLSEITDVKLSTFPLHPTLKFTYHSFRWSFMAGFAKKMPIVEIFSAMV